ncbi:PREDICTED: reticulon-4-interacting protein 1 homolog, mitochondrial [Ceratosolen solmsi marchali]|uniref:Reticulon-4-interacting protein 1 homolog, mitochondrial n=1 Tax=Ceratosolen solmsi marchali TaxID=326594 RepID=A0AAJ6YTP0_9HYME|nr:PREDICTED: reticulon-4-interacting protein 1 homolog, mitochondrial [Ceratosolen solmsi marchali]
MIKIPKKLSSMLINPFSQPRCFSQASVKPKNNTDGKMNAWQIHCYTDKNNPHLSKVRIPILSKPSEVLIKVDASSINQIDIAMTNGYGAQLFNCMRKVNSFNIRPHSDIEFPLILGRDFSGTIVSKGHGVDKLQVGDEVWGVIPIQEQGCHAEYALVDSSLVSLRPKNLSYIEAAAILYAGLTAWSSLWYTGGLAYKSLCSNYKQKPVLVLGGSGGVGTLAIQLLKAWKIDVVATCSNDAITLLEKLGANIAIDYTEFNANEKIIAAGPYDIILDCCNQGSNAVKLNGYPHYTYITLNSPLLKNYDKHGLVFGTVKSIADLLQDNIPTSTDINFVKWGYFIPSPTGINVIQNLIENKQITPVIQEVFHFNELPTAYNKMREGHLRGKIIIDMR